MSGVQVGTTKKNSITTESGTGNFIFETPDPSSIVKIKSNKVFIENNITISGYIISTQIENIERNINKLDISLLSNLDSSFVTIEYFNEFSNNATSFIGYNTDSKNNFDSYINNLDISFVTIEYFNELNIKVQNLQLENSLIKSALNELLDEAGKSKI